MVREPRPSNDGQGVEAEIRGRSPEPGVTRIAGSPTWEMSRYRGEASPRSPSCRSLVFLTSIGSCFESGRDPPFRRKARLFPRPSHWYTELPLCTQSDKTLEWAASGLYSPTFSATQKCRSKTKSFWRRWSSAIDAALYYSPSFERHIRRPRLEADSLGDICTTIKPQPGCKGVIC